MHKQIPRDRGREGFSTQVGWRCTLRHSWPAAAHEASNHRYCKQYNGDEEHDLRGFYGNAGDSAKA
jgi:hypothetical protein